MCGIAGVVGAVRDHSPEVRAMCDSMAHRGPDGEGYFAAPGVNLGMRRLAIVDVDHGIQPVHSENRQATAIFNGEIYNYRDLQGQLRRRGHILASESDSETLVHLYEEHGGSFIDQLRGMFAIALWDSDSQTLILTRDRLGKKPLYYYAEGGRLWFASELKALMAIPVIRRDIDPIALRQFLQFRYIPQPLSIFRGIRKLPPGHQLIWRGGDFTVKRYWRLAFDDAERGSDDLPDLEERFREQLLEATAVRMHSDRPLGAFLSGGLDSSAVVAAMARVSSNQIKTFSIGFEQDEFNELPHARRVADLYGTEHHEMIVTPDIEDLLPRLVSQFDEPFADSSAIPSFYLAQLAREHVVVALNGDGGDEALAGYSTYKHFLRVPATWVLPPTLVNAGRLVAGAVARTSPDSRLGRTAHKGTRLLAAQPWERYGRLVSTWTPDELDHLLRPEFALASVEPETFARQREVWNANLSTDPVNRLLAVDVETYLTGDLLPKVDITTMAVSLEARSPLLDHQLMQWCARLPGTLKLRGDNTKYLMRRSLMPWLPTDLIHRRKQGFAAPMAEWLAGPLHEMTHDLLLSPNAAVKQYLQPSVPRQLIDSQSNSQGLYSLLVLEIWLRGQSAGP